MRVELQEAWLGFDQAAPLYQKTGDAYFDDNVLELNALESDRMPVSKFMKHGILDGSLPGNISFREKRNIAPFVPEWDAKTLSDAKTRYEKLLLKQRMQEEK